MPERLSGLTRISRRLLGAGFFVAASLLALAIAQGGALAQTELAQADPPTGAVPQEHLDFCLRCHGTAGLAANPAVPDLANQRRAYLERQIVTFRWTERRDLLEHRSEGNFTGLRDHPAMGPYAARIPDREIPPLVEALSAGRACRQPPYPPGVSPNRPLAKPALVERCFACHGSKGSDSVNALVPRLAGQSRAYLANQLFAMRRAEYRQEGAAALTLRSHPIMNSIAAGLGNADLRAIADYLSTLPCS